MFKFIATVLILLIMTSSIKQVKLIRSICSHGLLLASNCDSTCPGYTLTYECTVLGGGWQGSALHCQQTLSLRHSRIKDGTAYEECNSGQIIARDIGDIPTQFDSESRNEQHKCCMCSLQRQYNDHCWYQHSDHYNWYVYSITCM